MPDVPNVPGVPALLSYAADVVALLTGDLVGFLGGFGAPQWGVYLDGQPVLSYDNQLRFEHRQDAPISTYPVEQGGFNSYNKVVLPQEVRVTVSTGGSVADRQALLASIDEVFTTVDLYDVVTPEQVFSGFNFTHRDLVRDAQTAGLIAVVLHLEEVRQTGTATFTNTQQPGDAGAQNSGTVQPQAPSSFVQQQFDTGAWEVQ